MSYRVRYHGSIEIECDTVEDVIAIAKRLARAERLAVPEPDHDSESQEAGLEVSRIKGFLGQLKDQGKRLLGAIAEQAQGKTDRVLRQMFDLSDNKALGGMLAGLSKIAANSGIDTDTLYKVSKKDEAGERVREYRPTKLLREAAKEAGWKVN